MTTFTVGSLVRARGREWVVQPGTVEDFLLLQPLGGGADDITGVFADEGVTAATFPAPTAKDLGDSASTGLLRTALRVGFQSSAGPFRSLAGISVSPRSYQLVPLLMALKQPVTRLLIADDVGIGKTIEAGLIAAELLAQGTIKRFTVLCSPALAEQWQRELKNKFGIEAVLVLTSTARALERGRLNDESVFERFPFTIVSSDFIKSERRQYDFLRTCPELVIVDEAHNSVAGGGPGQRARHQRYELLQKLAADPDRHLVLATATPHSGDEEAFANLLGLLDPALAEADLSTNQGRALLAKYFVQRRRADIRHYLDEDTPFPQDRQTKDHPYTLSPKYQDLFGDVLAYARESVKERDGVGGRVQWWSALALLRALASSPVAAAATMRRRAANADADDMETADALGRAGVLDGSDDETLEGLDVAPGAETAHTKDARRLRDFATRAEAVQGPELDRKLGVLSTQVSKLLKDGYAPIVFCRFIDTATYVGEHLTQALGKKVTVGVVTGQLAPEERERRVAELTAIDGQHVLVATDCLSEGVNLQDAFSAVVHYDLAWNPTRHEQREGRVDRYGQKKTIVRAITVYGEDNGIDQIVLDVLIRKHRSIAKATGVAVPVPGNGQSVIDALTEGLLLRTTQDTLALDLDLDVSAKKLDEQWNSAAEKEKTSRTRYAQHTIKPEEVAAEVAAVRDALGDHGDLRVFLTQSLTNLGATITPTATGFTAVTRTLPLGLRASLGDADTVTFVDEPPAGRREAVISRTDPTTRAVARYVLESALDDGIKAKPAKRAGVMRTSAVSTRTTLLLVRFRFQLALPGDTLLVAEDARVLAFEGSSENATWLDSPEALLTATPTGNVTPPVAEQALTRIVDGLPPLTAHLDAVANEHAQTLLEAHRRTRVSSGQPLKGLSVTAQKPVDVLSIQILLPPLAAS